jgi:hypothetical protein
MSGKPQYHELMASHLRTLPYSGPNSTIHAETVYLRSVAAPVSCGNSLSEMRPTNQKGPQEWAAHRSQQSGTSLLINLQGADRTKEKNPYRSER